MADVFGNLSNAVQTILLVGSVAVALTQCFMGFRLLRFWASFAGFVIGFILGAWISAEGFLPKDTGWAAPLLIALVAGILMALFAYKLVKVGIFLFCGVISWQALGELLQTSSADGVRTVVYLGLQGAAFFIAGWLAVKFMRTAIIAISAIAGSWTAIHGLESLIPRFAENTLGGTGCFLVLAVAGIVIQFLTTRD